MRFVSLLPAIAALFVSGAAYAQAWDVYANREDFFTVNLPGDPVMTERPYKTEKGANLTAHVYTAVAAPGTRLSGKYTVTVVDYSNAKNELGDAIEQARRALLAKGVAKYDEINNLDFHRSRRMTVESPTTRILGEILISATNRLYITEAETALNIPPPANFQASLQILNNDGVRIRERTAIGAPENEVAPVGPAANAAEAARVAALTSGAWRMNSGASCQAAYFKSGARTKTVRDEDALSGTVVNAGTTIAGQLIIVGPREGQFIDTKTDRAIMLFEPLDGTKLNISAVGAPALGWPDVTLELCPGSRA